MRRTLTLLLLLTAGTAAADVMSLQEAVAIGLEHNFDIRIARDNAESARIGKNLGRAGFLPRLSAQGGYTKTWSEEDSNSGSSEDSNSTSSLDESETDVFNAGLSLNWTIFDGREMFIDRDRYNKLAVMGDWQARLAIEGQVASISQSYYNLVLQRQLLAAATETGTVSADRLEQTRVRQELGGAGKTELLNAQVAWNADRSAILEQELQADIARRNLNLLLGRDGESSVEAEVNIPLPDSELDEDLVREQALAGNSALKLSELNLDLAGHAVDGARADYWPTLSLNSSYGFRDYTLSADRSLLPQDITSETRDLSVGLSLSYDIFDGGYKKVKLQRAKVDRRIAGLEEEQARRDLNARIDEALHSYEQKLALAELEAENENVAEHNLELQERLYEYGASTSLEFRDAQLSLDRARSASLRARFQAYAVGLEIERLTGTLLD